MSNQLKFFFFTVFVLAFCFAGSGQTKVSVSGTVASAETKKHIENVSVLVKGTKRGTVTNENGKFNIAASPGETLVFSFVGFASAEYKVRFANEPVLIELTTSSAALGDVVVVGVQRQTKRTTLSAISSVSGKDIENMPAASVDELLQGRVSGLDVQISSGEPGVAPSIVVRGNTRINTNINNSAVTQAQALSGPLYVIDGIPTNPDDISNAIDNTGTNYLAGININDIESVDIQKDATATAAWGSRGANGVIYIKTRKGRALKPEFRVNVYNGITQRPQLLKTATGADERAQKMNIIRQYVPEGSPVYNTLPQLLTDSLNPYFNNATDWQGLFYRTGAIQNVDMTISAANDLVNYRISMNYYNEKGIIEAFGFKRYSLRGNFDFKISSKLNSQFIVAASVADRKRGRKYYNSDDNTPLSGAGQPSSFYLLNSFDSLNFSGLYSKMRNKNINDYYSLSLNLNYDILPSLKYSFQGAANVTSSNRDYFSPANIDQIAALGGTTQPSNAESDKGTYSTFFISNSLNFIQKITTKNNHTHNFVFTGSQQFNVDVSNTNMIGGYSTPSNDIQVVSGVPQSTMYGNSDYRKDALLSVIGQFQYNYDQKYLFYAAYRGDASSRFGADTKWGYFPALGVGWLAGEEKFMESVKNVVSFLKLRASWGLSGSQSPDFYAPYNSYIVPGTYNGAPIVQPSYTNGLTKDNLTWAKTEQKDIGLDAQLFNNRISLTIDIYDKISKDDYYNFPLPFYTGFQSIDFNAHDLWVSNRGADITIGGSLLSTRSPVQWRTQITFSYNKNAIAKLPNDNRTFTITDVNGINRIFEVGKPIYEMFQLRYKGVYNKQSDIPFDPLTGNPITYFKGNHKVVPGDPIWEDVNKIGDVWTGEDNGTQYGDQVPAGNPNPKFTGGWVNDLSYKNFSLSIVSVFTWKRDVVNTYFQNQISGIVGGYSSSINSFAALRMPDLSGKDYWTPEKAAVKSDYKANFPSINPFGPSYYQYIPISNMFNEDGSYFKVKSITVGYQVPRSVIKKSGLTGIKFYAVMDNVLILKKSSMPDPEAVDQLGVYTGGLYPQSKKYTIGVDVQF